MLSHENNFINTDSILTNNQNINLHSIDNSYGLNVNHNSSAPAAMSALADQVNNVFASAIPLTTVAPDLIVQNVSAPTTTTVGSTIQLNYQVKNQGNANAGSSYSKFYISKDATLSTDDVS